MGTNILRRATVSRTTHARAATAEISRQELHGLIDQTASPGDAGASELEAELELVDAPEATPVPRPAFASSPGASRLAHTLRRDPTPAIAIGRPTRVMPPSAVAALVQSGAIGAPGAPTAAAPAAIASALSLDTPAPARTMTPTGPTSVTIATRTLARAPTERLPRAPRHRQLLVIALLAAAFAELAFLTLRALFR